MNNNNNVALSGGWGIPTALYLFKIQLALRTKKKTEGLLEELGVQDSAHSC